MDNLAALYASILNINPARFVRIDHPQTYVAQTYIIQQKNNLSYILKICNRTQEYACEVYFLNQLKNTVKIPRIIELIEPQNGINGALLIEYLPGTLLTAKTLTERLAYEIGSQLALIHLHHTPGYGDLTHPETLHCQPLFFIQKFQESVAECTNHLSNQLIDQCHNYFTQNLSLLTDLDGPCITHRDFHPGNIIVHEGVLQGIIDWSSGRAGFAQEDFYALERNDFFISSLQKQAFLKGYTHIRPLPEVQSIMPLLSLSKALGLIGFTVKKNTWNNRDRRAYEFHCHLLKTILNTYK